MADRDGEAAASRDEALMRRVHPRLTVENYLQYHFSCSSVWGKEYGEILLAKRFSPYKQFYLIS